MKKTLLLALTIGSEAWCQVDAVSVRDYMERVRQETGAPGISVAVAVGGTLVFSDGVGFAELDNETPASGRTVHNVGSVSKVLATVAVMRLVQDGKVSLDDPIQKYVPSFPEKQAPITLRRIMTHTSGIRHYKDGEFGPYGLREMRHFDDFAEAIEHFTADPLLFDPGAYWSYSSHAFNLLQGVVETASGAGFEDYVTRHVFEPAGMLASSFDVPRRIVPRRGRGYVRDAQGRIVNSAFVDVSYKYAGGGMLSTVEDLVRFGVALNHGVLLGPETLTAMYAVQVDPVELFRESGGAVEQDFKQAIGWRHDSDAQGRVYTNHTGTVRGTRSALVNYRDGDVVVAIQANILPFDSRLYARAIAQLYLNGR